MNLRTTREGALRVSVLEFILIAELAKLHLVSFRFTIGETGDQIFAVLTLLSFRFPRDDPLRLLHHNARRGEQIHVGTCVQGVRKRIFYFLESVDCGGSSGSVV